MVERVEYASKSSKANLLLHTGYIFMGFIGIILVIYSVLAGIFFCIYKYLLKRGTTLKTRKKLDA